MIGAPEALIISVNRFYWLNAQRYKIKTSITCPLALTLNDAYYILASVVLHRGTSRYGHYYCISRSTSDARTAFSTEQLEAGLWIKSDDLNSSQIPLD